MIHTEAERGFIDFKSVGRVIHRGAGIMSHEIYKKSFLVIVSILFITSCSTSSLSRRDISQLAAGLTYVTIPAAVAHTAADVRLHYVEAGNAIAPAIILIHGFAASSSTWKQIMPELAKSYHVFAIDMIGFGFSDKPADFSYDRQGYGETVLNFMEQKKIEKAIVVGNSMGGALSLWIAIHHPERVTRLILIDTFGYPEKPSGMLSMLHPWLKPFAHLLFGKAVVRKTLKQVYYDDSRITPELVEEYGRPFKTPHAKDVPFWLSENLNAREDAEEFKKLPTIKIPTLILWGENDEFIAPEHAKSFHHDIQGSELVMIPQCGHIPQEEKPEVVLRAILDFLKRNP